MAKQPGLDGLQHVPFIQTLFGRRSRRFYQGARIDAGPFAFQSNKPALSLTQLETNLVLAAVSGNTGYHHMIPFNQRYQPHLPNYAGAAGGRTFPSAAGFHTSQTFFTDDSGIYFLDTKNGQQTVPGCTDGQLPLQLLVENTRQSIRQLSNQRLYLPPHDPHIEGHNQWVANAPGSLFIIPVADLAEHHIANLCYYLQNGYALFDDIHRQPIDGLNSFKHLYDPDNLIPLSWVEQYTLQEATTELVTACYAGALMLQAMGLGGWMYNGVNPYSILGASGDPDIPGLGFRYDTDNRWSLPNPTGLEGVFEGHCPPHYTDMAAAVDLFIQRKFGQNGPFHPETPGPWQCSPKIRGSVKPHTEEFKECVTLQSTYIHRHFGRFPGTSPTILAFMVLQAQHIDLDYYDRFYQPGAYLQTHALHMANWHAAAK